MRSKLKYLLLFAAQLLLFWSGLTAAALYPQPPAASAFTITGFIQSMTLDNPADILSGGTVTVNGVKVRIPTNLIVVMSATNLSWQELWAFAPCPWGLAAGTGPAGQPLPTGACKTGGNGQTGLALSDVNPITTKPPLTTTEITILGNRIGNGTADPDYVAGIVYLAQQSLNLGQGFINFIDYATGTLHVGGVPDHAGPACSPLTPATGTGSACDTLIQINDPWPVPPTGTGRYGRLGGNNLGASPDPRFTADTDNPTIHAKTGYPMCIPRVAPVLAVVAGATPNIGGDSLCPQRNRPLDPAVPTAPLGNFTLCNPGAIVGGDPNVLPPSTVCVANAPPPAPGIINAVATVVPGSDATNQAPFMVGDYIEWSGTLQVDGTGTLTGSVAGQQYVSAHTIVANVGIYTSPKANPAYVEEELTILGTGGTPINDGVVTVPQEVTTRIKARGFFTDPTRTVDVFAVVPDPCTGVETEVPMLGGIPNQKGGVPWGRFRDIDQAGLFPITRQWRVKYTPIATDLPGPVIAANGLTAMSYTIPVSEFITPENTIFGDPRLLVVPNNFQDFPFLTKGEGPWRNNPLNVVGQLTPFPLTNSIPGLTPPAPAAFLCPAAAAPTVVITPPNQTVQKNSPVTLDASKSHSNPLGHTLSFLWEQLPSPTTVTLTNANTAIATFKAPNVTANTGLPFQVTVKDQVTGQQAIATTLVEVTPGPVVGDTVTIAAGGVTYRASRGVLNATAASSDITCAAVLSIQAFANDGTALLPANTLMGSPTPVVGGCSYTWVSGKAIFPPLGTTLFSVTVTSSLGGSNTANVGNGELRIR